MSPTPLGRNSPSEASNAPVATLRDVARAAGVSIASASRALAGERRVSVELQARIMAAAARLGYQTNLAARALVSRRSGLIGIVAETLADPLVARVVEELEQRLGAQRYGMLLATCAGPSERSSAATRGLIGRGAEALVFAGAGPLSAEVGLLATHGLPWLEFSDAPAPGGLAFDTGRRQGGALAARYLLELGHRRYGVVGRQGDSVRLGVATALSGSGSGRLLPETTMPALLQDGERPTAVICSSDAEALGAVHECSMRAIMVPEEIAIIGFGDEEFARHAVPGLTSIRVSAAAIGRHAAEVLLARLAGENAPSPFELPVKLVVRQSSGPPPA
jgi:LacI family transcriptional regulator